MRVLKNNNAHEAVIGNINNFSMYTYEYLFDVK